MIVFDNACDNGFTDLEAFWPQGKNGTIIITTRNTAASHHFAAAEAICLEPFEPAESALFLESMIANSSYTMPKYHDDKVIKIANLLGGLPLAISQMVGFLVESECPLGEFVALYSSYENIEALHSISTAGSTMFYQHTLSTVWAMSIAGLGHDATVMLDLIAFLDPDSRYPVHLHNETFLMTVFRHTKFYFSDSAQRKAARESRISSQRIEASARYQKAFISMSRKD